MFLLFDVRCQKCQNSFKAEADAGPDTLAAPGQYQCVCPRCNATTALPGEHAAASAIATGWAVRATSALDPGA